MLFRKWAILSLLLTSAVPAGCVPFFIAAEVHEEVTLTPKKRSLRPANATTTTVLSVGVFAAVLAIAVWRLRRAFRLVTGLGADGTWHDLSGSAWRVLLWSGVVLGVACGVILFIEMR